MIVQIQRWTLSCWIIFHTCQQWQPACYSLFPITAFQICSYKQKESGDLSTPIHIGHWGVLMIPFSFTGDNTWIVDWPYQLSWRPVARTLFSNHCPVQFIIRYAKPCAWCCQEIEGESHSGMKIWKKTHSPQFDSYNLLYRLLSAEKNEVTPVFTVADCEEWDWSRRKISNFSLICWHIICNFYSKYAFRMSYFKKFFLTVIELTIPASVKVSHFALIIHWKNMYWLSTRCQVIVLEISRN